jgi:hypothetical protein
MIKWNFLSVLLLGFFVSQPYIYSLTDGEKAKLQELSRDRLDQNNTGLRSELERDRAILIRGEKRSCRSKRAP